MDIDWTADDLALARARITDLEDEIERAGARPIDHETAEKLRAMLGDIQLKIIDFEPTWSSGRLVAYISEKGFRLIDDLEGVVR